MAGPGLHPSPQAQSVQAAQGGRPGPPLSVPPTHTHIPSPGKKNLQVSLVAYFVRTIAKEGRDCLGAALDNRDFWKIKQLGSSSLSFSA